MGAGSSAAAVRIPYLYNGIEHVSDLGLDINTALFRTLDPALGRWWQIDPKAEVLKSLSPYNAMNNNPILLNDPNGDIPAFILPTIGWSKNGGFSIGLEIGVGVPGVLSASLSVGYNFGSRSSSWSVQGYASGFYAGYGSQGAFGGWGYRYAGFSVGASYGQAGLGIGINYGVSQNNFNGSFGVGWSQHGGWDFNISAGYTHRFEVTKPEVDVYKSPVNDNFGNRNGECAYRCLEESANSYGYVQFDFNYWFNENGSKLGVNPSRLEPMIDNALYEGKRYFESNKIMPTIEPIKNALLNNQRVIMGFNTETGAHAVMVSKIKIGSSGKYRVYFAETSPVRAAYSTTNIQLSYPGARFWTFSPLPKPVPLFTPFRKI